MKKLFLCCSSRVHYYEHFDELEVEVSYRFEILDPDHVPAWDGRYLEVPHGKAIKFYKELEAAGLRPRLGLSILLARQERMKKAEKAAREAREKFEKLHNVAIVGQLVRSYYAQK